MALDRTGATPKAQILLLRPPPRRLPARLRASPRGPAALQLESRHCPAPARQAPRCGSAPTPPQPAHALVPQSSQQNSNSATQTAPTAPQGLPKRACCPPSRSRPAPAHQAQRCGSAPLPKPAHALVPQSSQQISNSATQTAPTGSQRASQPPQEGLLPSKPPQPCPSPPGAEMCQWVSTPPQASPRPSPPE